MLKRLSGTVLVSAGEQGGEAPEARRVRYAVMSGRKVERRGECAMSELQRLGGWDLRASFFSRGAYFERTQAQTENKRLANVVARRFIDGEMLFNEAYRLRLTTHLAGEHDVTLKLMAAAEIDCLRLEEGLPLPTRPVSLAALEEAAIAALIAKATREPVLALFARGERFVSFVAENGEVRQRRMESLPAGDLEAAAAAVQRAEVMAAGGLASGMGGQPGKEVALRAYLGDLRPLAAQGAQARDYSSREVEKRIAALIQGGDALAEPELYGLSYVRRAWNFLEDAQTRKAIAWHVALPTAAVLLGGTLLFGLLFALEAVQNAGRAGQIEQERQKVLAERDALVKRVPNPRELERFKDFTELLKRRSEQVRADRLLAWISHELPGGIAISSLQLYAQGDAPPEAKQQSAGGENKGLDMLARFMSSPPKEKPAQETKVAAEPGVYTLSLELTLPGSYDMVERQAAEVIRRLSPKLGFVRAHLDFDAARNRARLISQLTARAEDFR